MPRQWWTSCAAVLLALLGSATASHAQARSEEEMQQLLVKRNYARGGYYIGLSGMWALENSDDVGGQDQYLSTGGLDLHLGNRHNKHFASGFDAIWVHHYNASSEDFQTWGLGMEERIYLTGTRVQPYAVLGVGFVQILARDSASDDEIGFAPRLGAGVDCYVNESWAVTLDAVYHLTVGGIEDHDFVTVGLGFQFF